MQTLPNRRFVMLISRCIILAFLLFVTAGCEYVSSAYLVGERPFAPNPDEWNGKWFPYCNSEEGVELKVLDRDRGLLRVSIFKGGGEEREEYDCYLRKSGDWTFANLAYRGEFCPSRIKHEKNVIVVWLPDVRKFGSLVERGVLPGKVEDGIVRLDLLKPEHLKAITSEVEGVVFQWDSPAILHRQPG